MKESQYQGIIKKYGSIEQYKEVLHSKLSKHFYTNGIIDKKFSDDEDIPEGFYPGRTNGVKKEGFTKGTKWINNGYEEILIKVDELLPNGYAYGKLPQTKEHKENISKSLKGKIKSKSHCKHLSESHLTNVYKSKITKTMQEKYGVDNAFQIEYIIKEKCNTPEVIAKRFDRMRLNHTFNSSKFEQNIYKSLLKKFDEKDILQQYTDDRYPFNCDFYIKSLDLFIEINGHWTHGGRPYNSTEEFCQRQLSEWQEKSKNSKFYTNAINVWTVRDVTKLSYLKKNNLNYMIIYYKNNELDNILSNLERSYCEWILK